MTIIFQNQQIGNSWSGFLPVFDKLAYIHDSLVSKPVLAGEIPILTSKSTNKKSPCLSGDFHIC